MGSIQSRGRDRLAAHPWGDKENGYGGTKKSHPGFCRKQQEDKILLQGYGEGSQKGVPGCQNQRHQKGGNLSDK